MKKWEYAILSHNVKKSGGPEKYIATIRLHEHQTTVRQLNKKWIFGTASLAVILAPFAAKGISSFIKEHKEKTISDREAAQAEKAMTEEFEKYETEET